jgi:hypothetical protein
MKSKVCASWIHLAPDWIHQQSVESSLPKSSGSSAIPYDDGRGRRRDKFDRLIPKYAAEAETW